MLLGRDRELAAMRAAVDGLAAGRPFVVGVVGDEGSGRTSLLGAAIEASTEAGALVLAARGTNGDPGPAYGALFALLRPMESRLGELADDETAEAVRTALSLRADAVDAVGVGLGVLRLITSAAEQRPVVIALDDAAAIDEATRSALAFALTRLGVDRVGAFLGLPAAATPWDDAVTNRIVLGPLGTAELAAIIAASIDCDDNVALTCADWAAGSPLLALELARSLSLDERRGRTALPKVPRATVRAVERLQSRLDGLPERAKRACVVVAAAHEPSVSVVRVALETLGEPAGGLEDAEDADVIAIAGDEVAFTHPLLRPLAYHLVAASSRRAAHRALAAALDDAAPSRRARLAARRRGDGTGRADRRRPRARRCRCSPPWRARRVGRRARAGCVALDRPRGGGAAAS